VSFGLDLLESAGIETIHRRVECLVGWMLERLLELRHRNGLPLVRVYGPTGTADRGGCVALNLYHAEGGVVDHRLVRERAMARGISLRTGTFCNPGAGETALELSGEEIARCFDAADQRLTYDDFRRCISDKGTGAVRISLGLVSTLADVEALVELAETFLE